MRRQAQVLERRPDLKIVMLRGNVQTRLRKLEDGVCDATFLAVAGLERLGIRNDMATALAPEVFLPAVAQGAIGIEVRADDAVAKAWLAPLNDAATAEIEAKIIALHTDGKYGIYSSLDRDDPHRADILTGLPLRNSLNMAVMGYGLANLAIGTGAVIVLMGAGALALVAPVLYLAMNKEEDERAVNTGAPAASAA